MILTEEEVEELLTLANGASWRTFARAIEAAVLAKLGEQKPVAWMCPDSTIRSYDMGNVSIPLYTHPARGTQ